MIGVGDTELVVPKSFAVTSRLCSKKLDFQQKAHCKFAGRTGSMYYMAGDLGYISNSSYRCITPQCTHLAKNQPATSPEQIIACTRKGRRLWNTIVLRSTRFSM